ncbi:HAD family hydrolase [Arthrobacter sp. UYP6]|uniref:HAD family hydrolase n=1 Tax=Arthrobacter sp. UYP6 TaxID=1756378 RepID=UPI003399979E
MRSVHGVLFDIDETLVDLRTAMANTVREISAGELGHFSEADWAGYQELYAADPLGHYDQYLAGELSFTRQRLNRVAHAQQVHGLPAFDDAAERTWNAAYERTLPRHFSVYDDVLPLLDHLDARGIPYGAVSNNVHDYQRAKLDAVGLQRIRVLVGTDTVGVAKPDPAIFLEGIRLLGTEPGNTLYIGDNLRIDAEGACAAGLQGIWLDRAGNPSPVRQETGGTADGGEFLTVRSLGEVAELALR